MNQLPTHETLDTARDGRRRRVRLPFLLAAAATTVLAIWGADRHFADPERIRARAEASLQEYFHGRVAVGAARFSWLEGITLRDVAVSEVPHGTGVRPDSLVPKPPGSVFYCDRVELKPQVLPLLQGLLRIESVVAHEPKFAIVRSADDGRTNLDGLLNAAAFGDSSPERPPPRVELRTASVRVIQREQNVDRLVENITLTIRGRRSDRSADVYDLVWYRDGEPPASGHSQVDLQTYQLRNVRGGLPWMSLEAVMIAINAKYQEVGAWRDLLGLEGAVRARDYNIGRSAQGKDSSFAAIDLEDAALSIPLDRSEEPLAPQERYLRFERVYGTIELSEGGIQATFDAQFHGAACKAKARMRGGVERIASLADVEFTAEMMLSGLEVPNAPAGDATPEGRFIRRWPRMARFFADFEPHGLVNVEVEAEKRGEAEQRIRVNRLRATARGADASFRLFPYRVTGLTGSVEFSPRGIVIEGLHGTHDDGTVAVTGRFVGSGPCSPAEVSIRGEGIAFDAALCSSTATRYGDICDMFAPQGRVAVTVDLTRAACHDGRPSPWQTDTIVSFTDLTATYAGFAYPIERLAGTLRATGDRLEISEATGCAGDAPVSLRGHATLHSRRVEEMDVEVTASKVAIDETLLGALPAEVQGRVRSFDPQGRVDARAHLTRAPGEPRTCTNVEVTLHDVGVRHGRFPLPITALSGRLRVGRDRLDFEQVSGLFQGGDVSLTGSLQDWIGQAQLDLNLSAHGVWLDDAVYGATPESVRRRLSDWRVTGPLDVDLVLAGDAEDRGDVLASATAWIVGGMARHPRLPEPLQVREARLRIDGDDVRIAPLRADYGPARLEADVQVTGNGNRLDMTLAADGIPLDDTVRDLLPEAMRGLWDRLQPTGSVDVRLAQLTAAPAGEDEARVWTVDGRADLHDVALAGYAGLAHAEGSLGVSGTLRDALGGAALTGDLELDHVELLDRRLIAAQGLWSLARTAQGVGRCAMEEFSARLAGGALTGQAELLLDPAQTRYNASAMVHEMDLHGFLNPPAPPDVAARRGRISADGSVDARLRMTGVLGDSASRRGNGAVRVSEARIQQLPVMLAILQVLNLSIPQEEPLDDAEAEFYVHGRRVELRDILLRGRAIALVGSGSMSVPDWGLNLRLVSVNPRRWAEIPGLTDFMERATRELVELQVAGPLARPTVRALPMPGVTEELQNLFQKRKPKRMQRASR
ncbi:MAG: hypothetical protein HY763_11260 [Planctomycetes bacterium]|nr:hypothetical protein [Planctomycetota bacterium]